MEGVAVEHVQGAGILQEMSPFDAKMLAHLESINQKTLAMAVCAAAPLALTPSASSIVMT
jgi:hypothetical protein